MDKESRYTDSEFLSWLASSGQFDILIGYIISDEPLRVRRQAATLVADHSDAIESGEGFITQLVTAVLRETDDTVRAKAVETFLSIEDLAIDELIDKIESDSTPTPTDDPYPLLFFNWLDSTHGVLRELAVAGLKRVENSSAIPKLADACGDPHPRVRRRALNGCATADDNRPVEAVADCLDSDREEIRIAAAHSLAEIGTDDAIDALLAAANSDSLAVRQSVLSELGSVGLLDVFDCLLHAVECGPESIRDEAMAAIVEMVVEAPSDKSDTIRDTVAIQLDTLPDQHIVPRIIDLTTDMDRPKIRRNAIWLLAQVTEDDPEPAVIDCYIRTLRDTDDKTVEIAASNLVEIDDPAILNQLEMFIKSNDLRSETLQRADFIREQIIADSVKMQRREAVEYIKISEPAEYTAKKRKRNTE